jgi:hypothetical protein
MNRETVESSQLKSVGYDAEKQILEIEFKGKGEAIGGVYQYLDVPQHIHRELMAAESIGRYFGPNVRGKFQFKKLEPEKPAEVKAS